MSASPPLSGSRSPEFPVNARGGVNGRCTIDLYSKLVKDAWYIKACTFATFRPLTLAQLLPAMPDRYVPGKPQVPLPVKLLNLFIELGQ